MNNINHNQQNLEVISMVSHSQLLTGSQPFTHLYDSGGKHLSMIGRVSFLFKAGTVLTLKYYDEIVVSTTVQANTVFTLKQVNFDSFSVHNDSEYYFGFCGNIVSNDSLISKLIYFQTGIIVELQNYTPSMGLLSLGYNQATRQNFQLQAESLPTLVDGVYTCIFGSIPSEKLVSFVIGGNVLSIDSSYYLELNSPDIQLVLDVTNTY